MPSTGKRVRGWRFTVFEGQLKEHGTIEEWLKWAMGQSTWEGVRYLVFQEEICPKSGRHHVQGYIHLSQTKGARPVNTLLKLKHPCVQTCSGTASDNRAYCTDAEKRKPGTEIFEYGDCPQGKGERNDLKRTWDVVVQHESLDSALFNADTELATLKFHKHLEWGLGRIKSRRLKNATRSVFVMVYTGTPGAGKSELACHFDPEHCFTMPPPKSQNDLWFGDYDGERTLIIDEFEKSPKPTLSLYWIKKILDGRPVQLPVKNGHRWAEWDFVVVTTNHHPVTWFPECDDMWKEDFRGTNFGAEYPSALQRRIDYIYTFKGVWGTEEGVTYSPEKPVTLIELAENVQHDAEIDAAEAAAEQPVESDGTLPSNAVVQPDMLETLMQEFELQDNDFMGDIVVPEPSDDPDGIFLGTDGDTEPTKGINIDPSKDVY